MATVTTLRPSTTGSAVGWSADPSGTLHGVTSDDNDATAAVWSGDGSAMTLGTPLDSPPAGERRHLVRVRARGQNGSAWWAVRLSSGALVAGAAGTFGASPSTVLGSWQTGAPLDGGTILSCYVTGQDSGVRIVELYLDVDTRQAPTFTPQVLDGSDTPTTTIADTVSPTLQVTSLNLDGLLARQYRYWVVQGVDVVWDTGIVSGPPVSRQAAPLDNGTYTAFFQVWSTIGANSAYSSNVEQVTFDMAVGQVPTPDPPVVTDESPLFRVQVCAPDMTDFDEDLGWLQLQRVDCNLSTTLAVFGPVESDQCEEWQDFSSPRSGMGQTCDHEPEPCCFRYRVRSVGFVDGSLLVSAWSDLSDEHCLEWSEDEHLIRTLGPSGPMYVPVGGLFEWGVTRPFTVSIGVNGTRFVTSSAPGGRNFTMSAAVESEQELTDLLTILERPLVLVSPSDSSEGWAAPVTGSVQVVKVGRVRQVSAEFIATGPEPEPQLADLGL